MSASPYEQYPSAIRAADHECKRAAWRKRPAAVDEAVAARDPRYVAAWHACERRRAPS